MTYEFRVFLPIISDIDEDLWIEDKQRLEYRNKIDVLLSKLNSSNSAEERNDTYVVNHCVSYGLKYRAGTKLELKVMDERISHGLEMWTKTKYGKKGLNHHLDKIISAITQSPLTSDSNFSNLKLAQPKHLLTIKRRDKRSICIDNAQIDEEYAHVKTGYITPNHIHPREWVSICVEGAKNEVYSYLNSSLSDPLWELSYDALGIAIADLKFSRKYSFFPFVGGYPLLIMYIEGITQDLEMESILNELQNLIEHYRPSITLSKDA